MLKRSNNISGPGMQTLQGKGKIRLHESPYTFVRVIVMRTLLIKKEDYEKLMQMSLPEIATYLENTGYKKEIDELALRFSGIELIEQALFLNFKRTVEKLRRISPFSYNQVIDAYLLSYDIENIKILLRLKNIPIAEITEGEHRKLMLPLGILTEKDIDLLVSMDSIDKILRSLPAPFDRFMDIYSRLKVKNLALIENALDRFYYNELLAFAERIPNQGKLLKEFIHARLDVANLLTIFRLKEVGLEYDQILKYIIMTKSKSDNLLRKIAATRSKEELRKKLKGSKFDSLVGKMPFDSSDSLISFEIDLSKYLLERSLRFSHQDPLSIYSILSYLFAKETEIKNLSTIIKSKYLGLAKEEAYPFLVLA